MKSRLLIGLSSLTLAACATSVSPTYTSSGAPGYRIACGGMLGDGDLASCYQRAGELCETNGYKVLQTSLSSLIIQCRSADELKNRD